MRYRGYRVAFVVTTANKRGLDTRTVYDYLEILAMSNVVAVIPVMEGY